MKHIFSSFSKRFDCTKVKYINIVNRKCFLFNHKYQNIHEQKSTFFNDALLIFFSKTVLSKYSHKGFNIADMKSWYQIYENDVKNMQDRNITEFNYKLLNNLLCNNLYLSKWKQGTTKCTMYRKVCLYKVEYMKHSLYECCDVKPI